MTPLERKIYFRKWYLKNKAHRDNYNKKLREKHGQKYYFANKEEISRKRRIPVVCKYCKSTVSAGSIWSHYKTKKCIKCQPQIKFWLNFD